MNEGHFPDDALDDQLRRFYQDVYEPIEPASQVWKKLESQLDTAPSPRRGVLATLQAPSRGSAMPETIFPSGGMRQRLGAAVAVLATAIIILASLALFHTLHVPSVGSPSATHGVPPAAYSTANVPVTPVATPGLQSKYVTAIVTSNGVSSSLTPVDQTSHFPAGSLVDVVCLVRGIPKGSKHIISIHWYYDNSSVPLTGNNSEMVAGPQQVYFALTYPEPGLGMAKIFFDLPSSDSGSQANDPYLAGQIYFAIDSANAGTATPGTSTPGKSTPTGTKSATPTALIPGSMPAARVAWRPDGVV